MFKLGLEKAAEAEIKLPTSVESSKKQESSRKTSAVLTMPKPLTVWITINCGKFCSGPRTGKGQFSFQSQRKSMPKNVQTTAQLHSSHTSKVMLKIFQAMLQQYMNCELPDVQTEFRKGRGTRDQQHLLSHRKSKRVLEKQVLLLHWLC